MRLQGPRVVLREHDVGDAPAFHEIAGDPEVTRYLSWPPTTAVDEAVTWLRGFARGAAKPTRTRYHLAVEELSTARLVGGVDLEVEGHGQAELGYRVRRDVWGTGVATEAARLMVGFAFDPLGLHRVYATTDPENAASIRVLEKLGMRREGLLRERYHIRGEWRDRAMYAVLQSEWTFVTVQP